MQTSQRDTFLDVLRAGAILAVISQHWLMPVLSYHDGRLATGNALATPGWAILTWLSNVMPLVFFAGGAANHLSLARAASSRDWLGARLGRLLLPVLPLAAVWLAAPALLRDLGAPEQPVEVAGAIAGQLLWFLAVYLLTVVATPLMAAAHRRWGLAVPAALGVAAVLVDVVRFEGFGIVGYANAVFVWLAVHQLGFAYVDGKLGRLERKPALALAAAGFGVTALAVAFGPYPMSMIGMPGAPVSNMSPPSAVLLSVTVGQLGLALAFRPQLRAFAARPSAAAALGWINRRFMSVYLWHMPALVVVAGISVLGFGYATPEPGSLRWLAAAPVWFAAAAAVLLVLLRVFARFETRRLPAGPPAPAPQLVGAALLGSAGLLGLAARGFTTPLGGGVLASALPWVALVLAATAVATRRTPVLVRG
ncbi:acyltransferase family protein [Amycolatopsis sacchari]|uniref:Acyltransferase family protein n=1 Tax=Amycolatopsis sacchari TaxID=115433 RepID=A0A1I3UPK0_9PSEU|nr:acyltransferase [Amycolatopsis sacchari]SFJ84950.1 Acyltransferase family protein [Amycolatopsis sacchari]